MKIGFSPCPNDTFIFDALIHQKVDTEGLEFEPIMADVKELNTMAFHGELPISKLSFHAFAHLIEKYVLLDAGSALGFGCGPLVISKDAIDPRDMSTKKVAIPGIYTTANFLLSLAYPEIKAKEVMLFSEIENAVLNEACDAGLIIHENRFTYEEKGLRKIKDLGAYWEENYHAPIPLGGIMVRRDVELEIAQRIERSIRRSVEYAFKNPEDSAGFVRQHAQEMSVEVQRQHIELYVNEFSISLGEKGRQAVRLLFEKARELKIIPASNKSIFLAS